ncbi:hypothetical protein WF5505_00067 [Escherichia phage vB_EcoS_WF5505]|uniref:Uncharacterized protein n=1 Tax=Escherichia phage vB_EcoS_WF5505 TaxID=2508186 RepID=A0A482N275_9CAUD|nr:hypothetical protein P9605_gp05 [Escherichia phage vB_EcoS_WF5505]YP_010740856.1 hypothetical protein P9605_gp67 [Escherichia phage vB_EcoS_WF5505]QBQ80505.1 hypothetical protein WF5505_00005 [Escherichia phage vB_EcoS_WF5505]QBQ80567.1 hypothetical protein WF5505_00067 [Escherichia phage vB_EcoS_WF5505]
MKLLFRRNSDGYILKPIQTLSNWVRLHHVASDKVWWATKAKLPEYYEILTHDIERGDVLRDIRDGQLWVVEYVGRHGLRMTSRKDGVAGNMVKGMTYFGLLHYERVGRKYSLRARQPHERANAIADVVNRVAREVEQKTRVEFCKSQPAYATYDASKAQELIRSATHEIINHVDAMTNAKRQASEYGVGFIRVEQDGNMTAIDPRTVILK